MTSSAPLPPASDTQAEAKPAAPVNVTPDEAMALAGEHIRAGRTDETAAICRAVLSGQPDRFDAHHLLGGCALMKGNHAEAETHLRRALDIEPDDGLALANMGAALVGLRRSSEAMEVLERAIALRPDIAPAHDHLGQALVALEKDDEAVPAFERAIAADPEFVDARINLALVRQRQGRPDLAAVDLHALAEKVPDNPLVWLALTTLYRDTNFAGRAVECMEKALALQPENLAYRILYGDVLVEAGAADWALDRFRDLAEAMPKSHQIHVRLAGCLSTLGRLDEADAAARHAIDLNPGSTGAYFHLAHIHDLDPEGPEVAALRRMAEVEGLNDGARQGLQFALGRTYDAAGRYDEAFRHFREGNALRRKQSEARKETFDAERFAEHAERVKTLFSKEYFERSADWGDPSPAPVFIAGMPRSGTTLTEQIIASHARAFGAGELLDVPHMARLLGYLAKSRRPFPGLAADLTPEIVQLQARAYLRRLSDLSGGAERVTNKLPGNFMFVGLIALLFPNAPIIHTRRNAIDNCLSCFVVSFAHGHPYTNDLADLGHHWRIYDSLMDHWREVLPRPMLELDYEDMVAQPEATTRRLLEHCGLEWDDACLVFHRHKRPVLTASKMQVRKPIYKSSVERWRNYEAHLGPLIEALGDRAPV